MVMKTSDFIIFRNNLQQERSSHRGGGYDNKTKKNDILSLLYPSHDSIRDLLTTLTIIKNVKHERNNYQNADNHSHSVQGYDFSYHFSSFLKDSMNIEAPLFSDKDDHYDFKEQSSRYGRLVYTPIIKAYEKEFILPFIEMIESPYKDIDFKKSVDFIISKFIETHKDRLRSIYGYSIDKLINHIEDNNFVEKLFKDGEFQNILYQDNLDNDEFLHNNQDSPFFEDKSSGVVYQSFLDSTMVAHNPDGEIDIIHPLHTQKVMNQLEFQHLKHTFRKTPLIIKNIINECGTDDYGLYHKKNTFEQLLNFKQIITNNRNFLKTSKFDIIKTFQEDYLIESVVDKITTEKLYHENDNVEHFKSINEKGFDRKEIQNFVFNNIAHYQIDDSTSKKEVDIKLESFSHSLISYKNFLINGFNKDKQKRKINQNNHDKNTIFETENTLLQKIETASESLLYGNNTWCISRKDSYETYFQKYKKSDCNQYFYYDFIAENDNEIMIGITTDKFGNAEVSCDNTNRNYIKSPKLKDIEKLIKKHDKTLAKEAKKIGLKQ